MEGINVWLVGGGLAVGALFGLLIQYHRFCMVAATGNLLLIRDKRQVLAFLAALIVAITGTQLLEFTHTVAIETSSYRNSLFDWFGAGLGGLVFGVGSVIAGGCATRTLIRSAEGNISAIIALVFFMLFAAFAQFGFLEGVRLGLTNLTAVELTTDAAASKVLGLPYWLPAVVIVAVFIFYMVKNWNPAAKGMVVAGIIIGGLVVASWYITGVLAQDPFEPMRPSGITVSGPMARFGYILISGAIPGFSFTIAFVIGIATAVLLFSLATGRFKFEKPDKASVIKAVIGGSLMGIGAIMAYGCNVGQGLTGISTLSVESIIAFSGMFTGTALSIIWMEKKS